MVDTDLMRGMLSLMLYVLVMIVFIDLMFVIIVLSFHAKG
jgi:hypothetical protein